MSGSAPSSPDHEVEFAPPSSEPVSPTPSGFNLVDALRALRPDPLVRLADFPAAPAAAALGDDFLERVELYLDGSRRRLRAAEGGAHLFDQWSERLRAGFAARLPPEFSAEIEPLLLNSASREEFEFELSVYALPRADEARAVYEALVASPPNRKGTVAAVVDRHRRLVRRAFRRCPALRTRFALDPPSFYQGFLKALPGNTGAVIEASCPYRSASFVVKAEDGPRLAAAVLHHFGLQLVAPELADVALQYSPDQHAASFTHLLQRADAHTRSPSFNKGGGKRFPDRALLSVAHAVSPPAVSAAVPPPTALPATRRHRAERPGSRRSRRHRRGAHAKPRPVRLASTAPSSLPRLDLLVSAAGGGVAAAVSAIVDTGCSVPALVSASLVKRERWVTAPRRHSLPVCAANGETVLVSEYVSASVRLGAMTFDCELSVMPGLHLDFVLGDGALRELGAVVDRGADTVTVRDATGKVHVFGSCESTAEPPTSPPAAGDATPVQPVLFAGWVEPTLATRDAHPSAVSFEPAGHARTARAAASAAEAAAVFCGMEGDSDADECIECEDVRAVHSALLASADHAREFEVLVESVRENALLSDNERSRVLAGLARSEACFSGDTSGMVGVPPAVLRVADGSKPVRFKPYQLSPAEQEKLDPIIKDGLANGRLAPSSSAYASPSFMVFSGGKYRHVVNFKGLNRVLLPDVYPVPTVAAVLQRASSAKYFSVLDLASGFHQLPITKDSAQYTAFVTPTHHLESNFLSLGPRSAPAIFQRTLSTIFAALIAEGVVSVYIDDVLLHTDSVADHVRVLDEVLRLAKKHNLQFGPGKAQLLRSAVDFLGYRLSHGRVAPLVERLDAIDALTVPSDLKCLDSFLGLASFMSGSVPGCAVLCAQLRVLAIVEPTAAARSGRRRPRRFRWSEEALAVWSELKARLSAAESLALPRTDLPFILYVDASRLVGVGAVLTQGGNVLGYRSAAWPPSYTTPGMSSDMRILEAAGLLWGLRSFDAVIRGSEVEVCTDNAGVLSLWDRQVLTDPRIQRWLSACAEYRPHVRKISAAENVAADALSRIAPLEDGAAGVPLPEELVSPVLGDFLRREHSVPAGSPGRETAAGVAAERSAASALLAAAVGVPPAGAAAQPAQPDGGAVPALALPEGPAYDVGRVWPAEADELLSRFWASLPVGVDRSDRGLLHAQRADPVLRVVLVTHLLLAEPLPATQWQAEWGDEWAVWLDRSWEDRSVFVSDVSGLLFVGARPVHWVEVPVAVGGAAGLLPSINGPEFAVPAVLVPLVLGLAHLDVLHRSFSSTYARLVGRFFWRSRFADLRAYLRSCPQCQSRGPKPSRAGFVTAVDLEQEAHLGVWQQVHADLLSLPLDPGSGFCKVLVLADAFTSEVRLFPVKAASLEEVEPPLRAFLAAHPTVRRLVTDHGGEFSPRHWAQILTAGVSHTTAARQHPAGNGRAERHMQWIVKSLALATSSANSVPWPSLLPRVEWAHRVSVSSATGFAPGFLAAHAGVLPVGASAAERRLRVLLLAAVQDYKSHRALAVVAAANRRRYLVRFEVGALVLVWISDRRAKLLTKWLGPFFVSAVLRDSTYRVSPVDTSVRGRSATVSWVVHVSRLKRYHARRADLHLYRPDVLTPLTEERAEELRSLLRSAEERSASEAAAAAAARAVGAGAAPPRPGVAQPVYLPDDGEADLMFNVHHISGHSVVRGQLRFTVWWVGYDEPTLEPLEHLRFCIPFHAYVDWLCRSVPSPPRPPPAQAAVGAAPADAGRARGAPAAARPAARGRGPRHADARRGRVGRGGRGAGQRGGGRAGGRGAGQRGGGRGARRRRAAPGRGH